MSKKGKLCLALFLALAVIVQYSFAPQAFVSYADSEGVVAAEAAKDVGDNDQTPKETPKDEPKTDNQPGGDQPGSDQPGGDQPGSDQPGGDQPGSDQPGGDQPGDNQQVVEQPAGEQPGALKEKKAEAPEGMVLQEAVLQPVVKEEAKADPKADPTVNAPNVTPYEGVYDGSNHRVSASKTQNNGWSWSNYQAIYNEYDLMYREGTDGAWSTTNPSYKDVGTYTVYVRVRLTQTPYYGGSTKTYYSDAVEGTVNITAATVAVEITGTQSQYTYDGTEKTAAGFTYTAKSGNHNLASEVEVTTVDGYTAEVKETNASSTPYMMGLSKENLTISATSNVVVGSVKINDGQLVINKAPVRVTITGENDIVEYNGEEQSVEGFTSTAIGPNNKDFAATGDVTVSLAEGKEAIAKGTNANPMPYMMGLTANDFDITYSDNVRLFGNVTYHDGWLQINKAFVQIQITGNTGSYMFDNSWHSVSGFEYEVTVPGGGSSEGITVTIKNNAWATASRRFVGVTPMGLEEWMFNVNITGLNAQNYHTHTYDMSIKDGWIKILWIDFTVKGYDGYYDGQPHGVTTNIVELIDRTHQESHTTFWYKTDDTNWSKTAPTFTEVGTYKVYVQARNDNMFAPFPTTEEATVNIKPRPLTIKVADATKAYGAADPTFTASVSGLLEGDTVDYTLVRDSGEDPGKYSINVKDIKVNGTEVSASSVKAKASKEGSYAVSAPSGTLTIEAPAAAGGTAAAGAGGGGAAAAIGGAVGAAAAAPAAAAGTTIDQAPTPTTINDNAAPKSATSSWALINLISALLTALLSLIMLIRYFGSKREENEETGEVADTKSGSNVRLASLIPAIGGIVAFVATENMAGQMGMTDKWTVMMLAILAIQAGVAAFAKVKDNYEIEDVE